MSDQIGQDMHDLAIYDYLITSLITLKLILKDIDKISIAKDLQINNKIKQLEAEKIGELELLQEELRIITLTNKFLGRPNKIEEEIDLRRQTKKKTDNIEELKSERLGISKNQLTFLKHQLFQRSIYILSYKQENKKCSIVRIYH